MLFNFYGLYVPTECSTNNIEMAEDDKHKKNIEMVEDDHVHDNTKNI